MLWPILLLLASLVSVIVGLVAAFSGPFHTPSRVQIALVWLWPAGAAGAAVSVIWFIVLFVRWLA